MSFGFDYGGLLISSPFDFYALSRAADGMPRHPDIAIRLTIGALPRRRLVSHVWQGRFGLVLERGDPGDPGWTIRYRDDAAIQCDPRGTTLDCVCRDPASADLLVEILSRRVLPRLTNLHGRMPVHAAALANDDGAVLLFGTSGAGKSTLTAAAGASGWRILSDDMSILSGPGDSHVRPHVWQSAPGVSLWGDSREALALPPDACRAIGGYDGKYWFAPRGDRLDAPVALRALIFLAASDEVRAATWKPLSGPRAMMLAATQMVRFDPGDIDESVAAMDKFNRLVSTIPCFELSYPRRYAALPDALETIAAIQTDVRQTDL